MSTSLYTQFKNKKDVAVLEALADLESTGNVLSTQELLNLINKRPKHYAVLKSVYVQRVLESHNA